MDTVLYVAHVDVRTKSTQTNCIIFIFIFTSTITREKKKSIVFAFVLTPNLQTSDPIPNFPNPVMKIFRHSHTHPVAGSLGVVDDYYECWSETRLARLIPAWTPSPRPRSMRVLLLIYHTVRRWQNGAMVQYCSTWHAARGQCRCVPCAPRTAPTLNGDESLD